MLLFMTGRVKRPLLTVILIIPKDQVLFIINRQMMIAG